MAAGPASALCSQPIQRFQARDVPQRTAGPTRSPQHPAQWEPSRVSYGGRRDRRPLQSSPPHPRPVSKTRPIWPAGAAQVADWPRLPDAWGQPSAYSGAERCLRRASWPKTEPVCFDIAGGHRRRSVHGRLGRGRRLCKRVHAAKVRLRWHLDTWLGLGLGLGLRLGQVSDPNPKHDLAPLVLRYRRRRPRRR